MLSVRPGTVLDWWEAGKIPGYRIGGQGSHSPVRFDKAEITAWLARGRRGPVGPEDAR